MISPIANSVGASPSPGRSAICIGGSVHSFAPAAGTAKRTAQIEKMTPTAEFHARPDKPVSFNKALNLSSLTQDRPSA